MFTAQHNVCQTSLRRTQKRPSVLDRELSWPTIACRWPRRCKCETR
jgi:hypothetical protein